MDELDQINGTTYSLTEGKHLKINITECLKKLTEVQKIQSINTLNFINGLQVEVVNLRKENHALKNDLDLIRLQDTNGHYYANGLKRELEVAKLALNDTSKRLYVANVSLATTINELEEKRKSIEELKR